MYLTVRETLSLPPLSELKLVAGEAGLDRRVTRVSVLELVGGEGRWSRGGELFMSTLSALRTDDRAAHLAVVRNLDRNGAAAFCLHPGLTGHRFLDGMIEAANDCGLPLILLPEDMPYSVVTDAVMGGLLGRQAALLERSAAISRELTQATLRGSDLAEICRIVARRTQRPIAVFGADGIEILATGEDHQHAGRLPELLAHRAACGPGAAHEPKAVSTTFNGDIPREVLTCEMATPDGIITQVAAPVAIRDEVCAYLVTWEIETALTELDFAVLAHACTAVGLEVLKQRAVAEATQRIQHDFYSAALNGAFRTLAQAVSRAHDAGVEIAPAYVVAVLARGGQSPPGIARAFGRWRGSAAVPYRGTTAIVLPLPATYDDPIGAAVEAIGQATSVADAPDGSVPVGVSRLARGILNLPSALSEAAIALSLAERLAPQDQPLRYDDLGVFRLLAAMPDPTKIQTYVREFTEPLLCARQGDELARALEAYLDAQGSHREAAARLGIHPNTVKYRIAKVRTLLGSEALDNPTLRLGLHLALKARYLTNGRDAPVAEHERETGASPGTA